MDFRRIHYPNDSGNGAMFSGKSNRGSVCLSGQGGAHAPLRGFAAQRMRRLPPPHCPFRLRRNGRACAPPAAFANLAKAAGQAVSKQKSRRTTAQQPFIYSSVPTFSSITGGSFLAFSSSRTLRTLYKIIESSIIPTQAKIMQSEAISGISYHRT